VSTSRLEFLVENAEVGLRLDHFLAAKAADLSRSRLQALVREGHVSVDGLAVTPSRKVRAGERIILTVPPPSTATNAPEDIALDILFEDGDLIVINKPAGLVVHPAAGHATGTLVNALLHHCGALSVIGGVERPGIVHRLDKETSGCIVAAKNDTAHQELARQFASRDVTKIYLAVTSGHFAKKSGIISDAIGRHRVHRQKMAVVPEDKGRAAKTGWRILADLPTGSLVECTLHTGRTHQIRVHLKHIGHPLLGDAIYGKRAGFPRQMLHAWKLGLSHPRTGKRLDFVAPIPPDFLAAGVPANLS
jgi:23S rRNA pseudouridine1911/1915/1917 synthase